MNYQPDFLTFVNLSLFSFSAKNWK